MCGFITYSEPIAEMFVEKLDQSQKSEARRPLGRWMEHSELGPGDWVSNLALTAKASRISEETPQPFNQPVTAEAHSSFLD
jgi:hypothetical protein